MAKKTISATKPEPVAQAAPAPFVTYKGFDKNLQCRGFQYEIGATYDNGGAPVERCGPGAFHSCEHPLDILNYYPPIDGNRFASVSTGGEVAREPGSDTKIASAKITINAELSLGELGRSAMKWVADMAKKTAHSVTAGEWAHSATAGEWAHSATAGYGAHSVTAGEGAHSATAGTRAHSAAKGANSIAAALGHDSTATAVAGSAIMLAAYDADEYPPKLVAVRASMVGENGIEPGKAYRLTVAGEFDEVSK